VNGRVVPEYIGGGETAELVAEIDALEREQRRLEALAQRQEKDELGALEADLRAVNETINLAARAALVAAGFHQHKRGEWRKRRERGDNAGPGQPEDL
jgi:hypothetical protein